MAVVPNAPERRDPGVQHTTSAASEPSIAELLGGLIGDAQTLVRREIDLAKSEVSTELNKAKQAAISLGIGIGVTAIGGIVLVFMLVHLLHEVAGLSMWVSHLIVGGLFTIIGGILLYTGINRIKEVNPVPQQTIESVKKDVQWISDQTTSDRT